MASPFDTAGIYSLLTFDYARPLLRKGSLSPLQESDLPPLSKNDDVELTVGKIEKAWDDEQTRAKNVKQTPELFRALFFAFKRDFLAGSFLSLIEELIILAQVMLLRPFLAFIASDRDDGEGYLLAGMMALASLLQAVIHHQNFLISMRVGWNLRISMTGFLHKKLLKVSQEALGHQDSASVYNLIASDVQRFDNLMPMFHLGYWAFLGSFVAFYLLSVEVGILSALAGASTIVVYVSIQIKFAKQFGKRRRITAKITDQRVRLASEMLSGISSVKAYTWEQAFIDKLTGLRLMEHRSIFVSQSMKACTGALYFAVPAIASLATFSTYTYGTHHDLNVDRVYNVIAIINMMRLFIGAHLSRFLEYGPECYVASQRMQNFLLLDEVKPREFSAKMITTSSTPQLKSFNTPSESPSHISLNSDENNLSAPVTTLTVAPTTSPRNSAMTTLEPLVVEVSRADFGRDHQPTIENIDLQVRRGQLVMVAGPVGCGKSTLLEGLLSEVTLMRGSCQLKGAVAYSPQEAWIMAGSLQNNILFGETFDQARLNKVIDVCALSTDIDQLPDGLNTEIGEKGVNLSGGQRARVSLARACYAKADVVLLDDPLSAVDPSVAKHIFHKCIFGWLTQEQGAAVILVTHQRQFMPFASRIVLMDGGDVVYRKHRQSLIKLNNDKTELTNKLSDKYGLSEDKVDKIQDYGIESLRDLKDIHLLNHKSLSMDMGFDEKDAENLIIAINEDDDDDDIQTRKIVNVPSSLLISKNDMNVHNDNDNPMALFIDEEDDDDDDSSSDKAITRGKEEEEEVDMTGFIMHNNEDHDTTCGRITAQGNFHQLLSVGLVHPEQVHSSTQRSRLNSAAKSDQDDEDEDKLKEKIEREANEMIEKILKEKRRLEDGDADDDEDNSTMVTTSNGPKSPSGFTQLVGAEDREVGVVSLGTWIAYARASGFCLVAMVLLLFFAGQILLLLGDWWLVVWATANDQGKPYLLGIFITLTLSTVLTSFLRALLFFTATLKASSNLHSFAAQRLFASPLSFFAATPMGRVLNRFSADLTVVDEQLSVALFETIQLAFITASGLCIVCVILPVATVAIPPVLGTMFWLRQYTTASMRELKRMDGTTRSPCYTAFRAATVGLTCIRAYGKTVKQQSVFVDRLRRNAVTWYWWLIANRWFGFWLDFLVFIVVTVTTLTAVGMRKTIEPGMIGLALVYVLGLSGLFQYMMRQSAMVETFMTSVERINHYAFNLELEETSLSKALNSSTTMMNRSRNSSYTSSPALKAEYYVKNTNGHLEMQSLKLPKVQKQSSFFKGLKRTRSISQSRQLSNHEDAEFLKLQKTRARSISASSYYEHMNPNDLNWPIKGDVELSNLFLRYRHDLPEVVKGINVKISGGTKVGVVGRTGSGKSSLLLALSRLNEICGGQVFIDGVDSASMPLDELRHAISVIPQEPHLFSGTVRFNLDPYWRYDDHEIWNALEETKLKTFVRESGGLEGLVSEGGGNWSTGQKQLLSIARALLHRRKIVLLDEATASVDFENDQAIQRMLRTSPAFKDATLIVIAHRIDTIIDSDLVLVLDNGKLVEEGNPNDLMRMQNGIFATMVAASRRKSKKN